MLFAFLERRQEFKHAQNSGIAWAFLGEEENEEKLRKNEKKYRRMRKCSFNFLSTRGWGGGHKANLLPIFTK